VRGAGLNKLLADGDLEELEEIAISRNLAPPAGLGMRLHRYVYTMECKMNPLITTGVVSALMLSALTGCTNPNDPGQRAAGGALIGAGSGAAIGAIAGGPAGAAIGAGVGAVAGAAAGYATTPPPPRQRPYYPPSAPSSGY
jgi:hypothetical protein